MHINSQSCSRVCTCHTDHLTDSHWYMYIHACKQWLYSYVRINTCAHFIQTQLIKSLSCALLAVSVLTAKCMLKTTQKTQDAFTATTLMPSSTLASICTWKVVMWQSHDNHKAVTWKSSDVTWHNLHTHCSAVDPPHHLLLCHCN